MLLMVHTVKELFEECVDGMHSVEEMHFVLMVRSMLMVYTVLMVCTFEGFVDGVLMVCTVEGMRWWYGWEYVDGVHCVSMVCAVC